jgi:hypothetical protein
MLFCLLVVLPITIIIWVLLKLFRVKWRISFEELHVGVGVAILLFPVVLFSFSVPVFLIYSIGVLLGFWPNHAGVK